MITAHSDVVGSLLRPSWLLKAQQDFAAGLLNQAAFKVIEDQAVDEAVAMIQGDYNSDEYRTTIEDDFGLNNYDKVKEIVDGFSDRTGRDRETTLQHSEASL